MNLATDNDYLAVLDACVLARMPLCDTLLRCAEEPALFRPVWSENILTEVQSTLLEKFDYPSEKVERRIRNMKLAFPESEIAYPVGLLEGVPHLPDLNDRHVVAVAIAARAEVIVTANLKDFPPELLEPYGILVQHPDDFLVHQFHLDPDRIVEILDTQASAIQMQRSDILQKLRVIAHNFVKLVEP